ncbi:ABC transporter permease [Paenibacillus gorillae]|uniref:ABC transporter permease n=1 Tax=Paenibacillus gorillae TaxID=1243662 RepID=UPI0004ACC582|nr:ABC transporter permease [Paenibacillus gorillae]
MRKILVIAFHLIRRTMGTKRGFLLNILIPAIALSLIAGLFSNLSDSKPIVQVSNQDQGMMGGYVEKSLQQNGSYEIVEAPNATEQEMMDAIQAGKAHASVLIPVDFTSKLLAGETPQASIYRMGEQLWSASLTEELQSEARKLAAAAMMVENTSGEQQATLLASILDKEGEGKASVREETMRLGQAVARPEVIGIMIMFVMLLVSRSIGYVMEDREQRTMARMYAAPLRALDIAFGNFAGSMLLGTFQLLIVFGMSHFIFGFMSGVPFGPLFLVLECFLFAAVGMATLIGGLVKNSVQLGQINNLFITPTCMIGGCFWPLSMMPDFMQKLANFTPQKWAIQAFDRLSAGGTVSDVLLQLGILLLFALVLTAFGATVLRPNRTN